MNKKKIFRIGTRGSRLALWQANWIKKLISNVSSEIILEIVIIKTKGDRILNIPLGDIGDKGLFIKEIEEALIQGKVDLAVHSMKDMPVDIPGNLCIAAVPSREDPRDALISKRDVSLFKLRKGAKIGTSSLRRMSQLFFWRPDFKIVPLRGNLGTRIDKLSIGDLDGIILAAAGLNRLGYTNHISSYLETDVILPAVGQGAVCVEARKDDIYLRNLLLSIDDLEAKTTSLAERAFLFRLGGGCHVPMAANGIFYSGKLVLEGLVASIDGSKLIREKIVGPLNKAGEIGKELAEKLLSFGARDIIKN